MANKPRSAFGSPAINTGKDNVHPLSPVESKQDPKPLKGEEKIEPFGTRLPRSFQKRIKRTALERDMTVQEAAYEAFHRWMESPHPNDSK